MQPCSPPRQLALPSRRRVALGGIPTGGGTKARRCWSGGGSGRCRSRCSSIEALALSREAPENSLYSDRRCSEALHVLDARAEAAAPAAVHEVYADPGLLPPPATAPPAALPELTTPPLLVVVVPLLGPCGGL